VDDGTGGLQRALGDTGLRCHSMGFGCYRIVRGNETHEAALRAYLDRGGNLIDTSANYGDGLSEALVGTVLRDYRRDDIVVVTKGGYIQGQNLELAQQRRFPEVVYYGEGLWHSIHPEFLQTQIERSLAGMGIDRIDVYLLHNPEYFLNEAGHRGAVSEREREEFYRRIRSAFEYLEGEVAAARLSWYGISSNNFGLPASDPTMTSVHRCLQEARAIGEHHHFRVVQLPLNLYEPGGALEANNDGRSVLEYCRDEGIGVLVNRPLNAFSGNRMVRLADFLKPGEEMPPPDALDRLLAPLRVHERRIALELQLQLCGGGTGVSGILREVLPRMQSSAHWEAAAGPYLLRPIQAWLHENQQRYARDMRWQAWVEEFVLLVNLALEQIPRHLSCQDQGVSDGVRARLLQAGYPADRESLSRMAINVLVHLPGVSCVLNGMRRRQYVDDAMGVPALPPVDGPRILAGFAAGAGAAAGPR